METQKHSMWLISMFKENLDYFMFYFTSCESSRHYLSCPLLSTSQMNLMPTASKTVIDREHYTHLQSVLEITYEFTEDVAGILLLFQTNIFQTNMSKL